MITQLQDYLAKTYGIHFNNPALLAEAFTQASYVNEHPHENLKYYERIEFWGTRCYSSSSPNTSTAAIRNCPRGN